MRPAPIALWLRLVLVLALALVRPRAVGWAPVRAPIYVSSWAVQVSQGNREVERLARKFGFVNLGPIFPDGQYFHLRHRGVVQQSLTPHWGHRLHLKKNPKTRPDPKSIQQEEAGRPRYGNHGACQGLVQWFQQQTLQRRVKRSVVVPTDPWFSKQWYMNSEAQPDLSILQAWSQGLSGQGIVVSVLDDGIEKDHPDLWANYDPLASYDFNDYDPDPQPRYTPSKENRHGTRCAGEVAAMANNGFCGVGVAFNARIGGVRMLDGTITDVIEAQSLSLQPQHIHIYSASWGPEDDGRTVDGPGILTREAFRRGVTKHPHALRGQHHPAGPRALVQRSLRLHPHHHLQQRRGHRPPDRHHGPASRVHRPTHGHLGLSPTGGRHDRPSAGGQPVPDVERHAAPGGPRVQAGAPAGRGLEDQRRGAPSEPSLRLRAAGRRAAGGHRPHLAAHPTAEEVCRPGPEPPHQAAGGSSPLDPLSPILPLIYIRENVSACAGLHNSIRSLEHVQAQLTLSYSRRGDLEISLTSPMGTRSTLVAIRPLDVSTEGYNNWVFMSTHFWDENPQGVWTLGLENKGYYFNTGTLYRYTLLLYGTAEDMTARPTGPQVTSSACVQRDTEGLCQACDGPAYILGQLCLAYCPPRFFNHTRLVTAGPGHTAAPALRVCSSCHASCYTCRGGSPRDCTSCPPSSTLDQQQGSCVGPTTPDSRPRLRAAACPHHRCPASAMVLGLLAVTLGGPVLCGMSMDLPLYAWLSGARATPTKPQVRLPAGT
ncbi:proprotein convertase subtilisin/kexin type 4 isoform X4 [Pan troglodytes]|uniref:proprotein convertase subtilisin/kexin type 4 isoform X4 n=2 Tax=Pan troglodytes TaxID=9598 RepID=UPI0023F52783|nr:proprotein convertase subtilisin/kexin type 4 isoform X5 [Pan troglodytes]